MRDVVLTGTVPSTNTESIKRDQSCKKLLNSTIHSYGVFTQEPLDRGSFDQEVLPFEPALSDPPPDLAGLGVDG